MAEQVVPEFFSKKYTYYRGLVRTDVLRLGEEIVEISTSIMEVGEITAAALSRRDMAANELKVVTAQAAAAIRATPSSETGKPKSEAQVTADLPKNRSVKAAVAELEAVRYDAALWQALMDAFRVKQSALKVLAELTISGYLSASSVYDNSREAMKQARRERRREKD